MKKRNIKERHKFEKIGTFEAYYAACRWCNENGYKYGSTCVPHQEVAIMKGEYDIPQKWKNMTTAQRKSVDGVMLSYDYREGPVVIIIYE